MIRINLLPFRAARTKENVRRQVSIFILLIILMVAAMGAYSIQLNIKEANSEDKLKGIKTELTKYTAKAKEVDKIMKKNKVLQKKIDVINDLELTRKEPVRLFESLTDVIVEERMWLTNFDAQGNNVVLKGIALDEITVADFTKRLQTSSMFTGVVLKFLKHTTQNKIAMKSFEITCQIAKVDGGKKKTTSKAVK